MTIAMQHAQMLVESEDCGLGFTRRGSRYRAARSIYRWASAHAGVAPVSLPADSVAACHSERMRRVRAAVEPALASPREARNATAALLRREIHCALLVSPSRSPLCSSRELQHGSCSCAQPQSRPPCDREAAVGSVAHADFSGRGLISTQRQSRAGGSLADTPICRSDAPSDRAARARWFCWAQRKRRRGPSPRVSMRDRLHLSAVALTLLSSRDRVHAPLISRRRDTTPA